MAESTGAVKHVLLAMFKDPITSEQIDELIKGYASLVDLIEPMKSFHWGTDVSAENLHQGFCNAPGFSVQYLLNTWRYRRSKVSFEARRQEYKGFKYQKHRI
ncbi:Stress-response A/B barrel domain-containing protein [Drosera capensis]